MPDPVPGQPRRVALVIGIGAYETARKLVAPPGDAARMAQLLGGLGFKVLPVFNADFHDVRVALRGFYEQLRGAEIGLLYFSGHGVQDAARENYLLPADADLHEPEDLTRFAFSLRRIMADMNARVETGLIFLDACRDNPFGVDAAPRTKSVLAGGGGLAQPETLLGGMLVAFASDEGHVALDGTGDAPSPFTDALLRHLPVPGRSVTTALIDVGREVQEATKGRQMPWTLTSLQRDVVLVPARPVVTPATGLPDGVPTGATAPDGPVLDADLPSQSPAGLRPDMDRRIRPPPPPRRWVYPTWRHAAFVLVLGLGSMATFLPKMPTVPEETQSADNPEPTVQPTVQPLDCTGLTWPEEIACRVPDLDSADQNTRLVTAKEVEHALGDVSLSTADKAAIVAQALDMAEPVRFADLSQDGRFNVLARLASVPPALWLDPAMIAELERAHRVIETLSADTGAPLGEQMRAFLKDWTINTGYRPRGDVTVYPHFAGYPPEDFAKLMQALSDGWGWTLERLDPQSTAAGLAQIRYGTEAMRPHALLMAAQLKGQVPPHTGDPAADAAIRQTIADAGLWRVDVAQIDMRDGQLEIWIGR